MYQAVGILVINVYVIYCHDYFFFLFVCVDHIVGEKADVCHILLSGKSRLDASYPLFYLRWLQKC
jgi:hypothetical protein